MCYNHMMDAFFPVNPTLLQWVRDNHPSAESIMTDFDMLSDFGALGMLRHQVKDVANFTGIPTKDLAAFCRLIYEVLPESRLRIVLVDINSNGIKDGYTPLCQVYEDDTPGEVVERVYVQDLLDKYGIIYQEI